MLLTTMGAAYAQSADIWVSDEIEAPLRASPELNADIVAMLPAGQRIIAIEQNEDYVKIKTAEGTEGWLSNYYVLHNTSVHDQLEPMKQSLADAKANIEQLTQTLSTQKSQITTLESSKAALERSASEVAKKAKSSQGSAQKLASDNQLLQKKLIEQSEKVEQLAKALNVAKQKASTARTRYLSLVKVSENAVDIDKQNRNLQKKAVQFEQEIQRLKNDNQSLTAKLNTRQTMITALLIFGGMLAGYVLSILTPPRGGRPSSYNSPF